MHLKLITSLSFLRAVIFNTDHPKKVDDPGFLSLIKSIAATFVLNKSKHAYSNPKKFDIDYKGESKAILGKKAQEEPDNDLKKEIKNLANYY